MWRKSAVAPRLSDSDIYIPRTNPGFALICAGLTGRVVAPRHYFEPLELYPSKISTENSHRKFLHPNGFEKLSLVNNLIRAVAFAHDKQLPLDRVRHAEAFGSIILDREIIFNLNRINFCDNVG